MTVIFSEAELEALETLANAAFTVEPGTRCPICHRRKNKTPKETSPMSHEIRLRGPQDLVESLNEKLDTLQEYVGADPYSYPRLKLVELLAVIGIQQREQLRAYFEAGDETTYGEGA